ncbi:unnamed protein product, partial [Allacma fusca]
LLHKVFKPKQSAAPELKSVDSKPFNEDARVKPDRKEVVSAVQSASQKFSVLLKVAAVRVRGPRGEAVCNALFDDGATCTLVDAELAKQLGLKGKSDPLSMQWAHGIAHKDSTSQRVSFSIAGKNEDKCFQIQNARTIVGLDLPAQIINFPEARKRWKHLRQCTPEYIAG